MRHPGGASTEGMGDAHVAVVCHVCVRRPVVVARTHRKKKRCMRHPVDWLGREGIALLDLSHSGAGGRLLINSNGMARPREVPDDGGYSARYSRSDGRETRSR